jgi:hypothetical protein
MAPSFLIIYDKNFFNRITGVTGRPQVAFSEKGTPFRRNVNRHFSRLLSIEKSKNQWKTGSNKRPARKPKTLLSVIIFKASLLVASKVQASRQQNAVYERYFCCNENI